LNLVYTLRHSTILFLWCIFFFFEKGSLELFVPAEILLISASWVARFIGVISLFFFLEHL
jgi:hypothetical protein